MADIDTRSLEEELEQFKREKEQIRTVIGQIGGVGATRRDQIVNIAFIAAIALLFILDMLRHIMHLSIPLPPLFSLEVGILLVSVKIVWMIHKQTKVEHFQLWVLSSIEFRLNDLSRQVRQIERKLIDDAEATQTQGEN